MSKPDTPFGRLEAAMETAVGMDEVDIRLRYSDLRLLLEELKRSKERVEAIMRCKNNKNCEFCIDAAKETFDKLRDLGVSDDK